MQETAAIGGLVERSLILAGTSLQQRNPSTPWAACYVNWVGMTFCAAF